MLSGSIISKKGAESLSALVLDVKFGRAALFQEQRSAKELAQLMVGRSASAALANRKGFREVELSSAHPRG